MPEASVLSVLRERAGLQPNDTAFTFTDYDEDWAGVPKSLTWSQLYRRTVNVADELRSCGSVGDRAVILAPQGLDYITAFLGSMHAGFIAVPLSVPQAGSHDERVSAVLADTTPSVILTTSSVAAGVAEHAGTADGGAAPIIVHMDELDQDSRREVSARPAQLPSTAYLQYTSGSTRVSAGVMISHRNLQTNFEQLMYGFFPDFAGVGPPDTTVVSWLPFYHDMGLVLGVVAPILSGYRAEIMSPIAFLQRPARWMQSLANSSHACSAGPNFAFDLAARKTSDEDMAGLDLGSVLNIANGSERVHPATLRRFADRFAPFNLDERALRPSYGLAEATVYVATHTAGGPTAVVHFETDKLSAGTAKRCADQTGTPLTSYGLPKSPTVRVVDPDTCTECPPGIVGEVWVHGPNVAEGYWQKPAETQRTFGAQLAAPSVGTPEGPWLRTGDMGFISEDELFIVGRFKDLLIVYGRNHYPEDIEATVRDVTGGRVAAIAVPVGDTEKLVVVAEIKKRGDSEAEAAQALSAVKNDVAAAISKSHGLSVADLVLVAPGALPTTTSGKIRRAASVEHYLNRQFTRLDA